MAACIMFPMELTPVLFLLLQAAGDVLASTDSHRSSSGPRDLGGLSIGSASLGSAPERPGFQCFILLARKGSAWDESIG